MVDAKREREIWILGLEEGCAGRGSTLCGYLRDGGYKSRPAKLEDLETAKPQGILLDLSPFSTDGWGILLRLISSPKTRDIPILPLYLSMEGKVGGVFPCAGFFTVPVDTDYMAERLAVMGLAEDAQMWDLRALIVSRSGEEQLSKAVEALDFEVVKAYTGKEGLALASTSPFYMAFSTLMLPDMSAFELLERLRLYPRTRNVPFFILVKDNMKEGERTAMSRQIDHLVRKKGLSKEEFLGYIRRKGE